MKKLFISILVLSFLSSCSDESMMNTDASQKQLEPTFVANQILIKFKPTEAGAKTTTNILSLINATTVEELNTKSMQATNAKSNSNGGKLLLVNSKLGTMEAIDLIKDLQGVEYAEPNWIYNHHAVSNDTYYTNNSLWGMYGNTTSP